MADVVANGVRLHVQRLGVCGGARTVVFLHGLVMDNLSSFYFTLANPIALQAEVVLYDLRGHGMSERPASGYAVQDMVADLGGLLDALGLRRPVTLVGNSFGGQLALTFAARHPARVAGLILIDGHDGGDGWSARMAATLALRGDERDRKIAESFQSWLGRHSERKRTRLARSAQALVERTSLLSDVADPTASAPLDDAALSRIHCPVLAIYGESSDVRTRGEHLARSLPDCTFDIVPGCSHSVLWEATARVRQRVLEWIGGEMSGRSRSVG
jgi:pimeloyl-ACP methyl ester carboxylesterase